MAGPPASPSPLELKQAGPAQLRIVWSDHHESTYPVLQLRRSCRCAACVDEWSGAPLLDPGRIPADVRPVEIHPVGRYAINILWSDGHSSGIYTYEHLRAICPCPACAGGTKPPEPGAGSGS